MNYGDFVVLTCTDISSMRIEHVRDQFAIVDLMHRPFFFVQSLGKHGVVLLCSNLMQHGIDLIAARAVSPCGGKLLHKIRTDVTTEWYIVVANQITSLVLVCPTSTVSLKSRPISD